MSNCSVPRRGPQPPVSKSEIWNTPSGPWVPARSSPDRPVLWRSSSSESSQIVEKSTRGGARAPPRSYLSRSSRQMLQEKQRRQLRIDQITKRFDGARNAAISNATMRLQQGTIKAVVGPNGSGKSTLFRMVAGVIDPDSGTIDGIYQA